MIAVLDDDPTGSQTVHDVAIVLALDDDELAARRRHDVLPDQHALAARGRGGGADRAGRAARCSSGTQRSSSSAAATRRCAGTSWPRSRRSIGPAAPSRQRLRRHLFGLLRGRTLHPRRHPLGGRRAGGRDGVRAGRDIRLPGVEPARVRGREARRHGRAACRWRTSGSAARRAAPRPRAAGRRQRVTTRPRRRVGLRAGAVRLPHRAVVRARARRDRADRAAGRRHLAEGAPKATGWSSSARTSGSRPARSRRRKGWHEFELDVSALDLAGDGGGSRGAAGARSPRLHEPHAGARRGRRLAIAGEVSAAVTEVVRAALEARPAWVLAKGGITSHDVAVHGLGIRRAGARPAAAAGWCACSGRSRPTSARSGCRTWSSPATSATRARWPRSSSGSAPDARHGTRVLPRGRAVAAITTYTLESTVAIVRAAERSADPCCCRPG